MRSKLLYIIILNYNGYADTIKCIQSVMESSYQNFKILIVDNCSQDNSADRIKEAYEDVPIIQTDRNLGFAGGNNIGIKYALQEGAEYICLLNNDVLVAKDMFDILVQSIEENERSIVGPATLFWERGQIHSTGMKVNFWTGTVNIINLWKEYDEINKRPINCDYLEGSCLVFSKSLIQEVGLMPEEYFLYYEETDWCCKAIKKGYNVVCIPFAKLWHKGSASVNKISGLKLYFEDRNRVMFERKNAPFVKRIFFYVYFCIQTMYRLMTKQRDLRVYYAIRDGFTEKIDWTIYSDKN